GIKRQHVPIGEEPDAVRWWLGSKGDDERNEDPGGGDRGCRKECPLQPRPPPPAKEVHGEDIEEENQCDGGIAEPWRAGRCLPCLEQADQPATNQWRAANRARQPERELPKGHDYAEKAAKLGGDPCGDQQRKG